MTLIVNLKPESQAAHAPEEGFEPQPLETTVREMAQFSDKIPSLPDEGFFAREPVRGA